MLDNGKNPRNINMMLAHEIPEDALEISVNNLSDISQGEHIIAALVNVGSYKSKSEARRVFLQGGAQINGVKVIDTNTINLTENFYHKLTQLTGSILTRLLRGINISCGNMKQQSRLKKP